MTAENVVRFPAERFDGDQEPIEPFQPFYASRLAGYVPEPRNWLVDGLIARKTVSLMPGPQKCGKSLVLQQLASCLAMGRSWLGHATAAARCFAMFTEDDQDELARRQLAINAHLEIEPFDTEINLSWDARAFRESTLVEYEKFSDKPRFTRLWHQLWDHVADDGIEVIILDPTGVIFGGNENFKRQVVNFIRELTKKAAEINGAIILAAHPAKSDPTGYAGNGAWLGCVRFATSMQFHPEYDPIKTGTLHENERFLRVLGGNYVSGRHADHLIYREGVWQLHDGEDDGYGRRSQVSALDGADLRYRLLQGITRAIQMGARIHADEMHGQSAANRARKSRDPSLSRVPLNRLYDAQAEMIRLGELVLVNVGGACLVRPQNGPAYASEKPWQLDMPT